MYVPASLVWRVWGRSIIKPILVLRKVKLAVLAVVRHFNCNFIPGLTWVCNGLECFLPTEDDFHRMKVSKTVNVMI